LCTVFEQLTARSIFEEFEDRLAGPLGMEDFHRSRHTRYVAGKASVHPAYPFQLSTRDLTRFGVLFLHAGRWRNQQLIDVAWIRESTKSYSAVGSGGYGYMWWVAEKNAEHFPGVSLPLGSFSACGYRGQYLVVIPNWGLVVSHRVNSFQSDRSVSKIEFGKLLSLILSARPKTLNRKELADDIAAVHHDGTAYDFIIRNGEVIDGTGNPRFRADIAIRDGRIAMIGSLDDERARRFIDAKGKLVVPGFIDLHSHAEKGLVSVDPARRSAPNLITQGITTVVVNQDGGGPLDLAEQQRSMEQLGIGINVVQLIGHGTIRREVMPPATPALLYRATGPCIHDSMAPFHARYGDTRWSLG
jgi:hypothetical protein